MFLPFSAKVMCTSIHRGHRISRTGSKNPFEKIDKKLIGSKRGWEGGYVQWSALQSERISVAPDSTCTTATAPAPANSPATAPAPAIETCKGTCTWSCTCIFTWFHQPWQRHLHIHQIAPTLTIAPTTSADCTNHFSHRKLQKTSLATAFHGNNKLWSKCIGQTWKTHLAKKNSHLRPLHCKHSDGITYFLGSNFFWKIAEEVLRRSELRRVKMQRVRIL